VFRYEPIVMRVIWHLHLFLSL